MLLVAILNLAYIGVEFIVARLIGSVSLFADIVEFLEARATNLLIFVAAVWSPWRKSYVGSVLAFGDPRYRERRRSGPP